MNEDAALARLASVLDGVCPRPAPPKHKVVDRQPELLMVPRKAGKSSLAAGLALGEIEQPVELPHPAAKCCDCGGKVMGKLSYHKSRPNIKRLCEACRKYNKRRNEHVRYHRDADFREKRKARALEDYYRRKGAK